MVNITNYEMADNLKSEGFSVTSKPFETALQGNTVLILASSSEAANICERSYYKRLANKNIKFKAKKWKFYFLNGGRLEIYTPSANPDILKGFDRKKTFYSLYRD
jgi:hypothetical protein